MEGMKIKHRGWHHEQEKMAALRKKSDSARDLEGRRPKKKKPPKPEGIKAFFNPVAEASKKKS